jgi:hypothetical protein
MRKLVIALVCGTAWFATPAPAATAAAEPVALTGNATAITPTSATLNGTVNPEGQSTSYHFEYGTTTSYGSETASADAGAGAANVKVSVAISPLAPNTTYHYRLVATNATGTTLGADVSFRTPKPPVPTVSTRPPIGVTQTSATLMGAVNPRGEATSYVFQYGTSVAYGSQTAAASAGAGTATLVVSAAVGPLTPNTTYHYRLAATNVNGTTFGHDVSFKTAVLPSAVTIAAAPAQLTFGQLTSLSGRVLPPRPAHATVTLERAPAAAGPWTDAGSTTASSSGVYSFSNLAPTANTYYRAMSVGATSATVMVVVHFRISLFVGRSRAPAGSLVRFHGYVAPGHRGHLVLIQRLGHLGRWHTIAFTRLRRFGFYSVKVRIRRTGHFRAVVVPDLGHAAGTSRAVRIRTR